MNGRTVRPGKIKTLHIREMIKKERNRKIKEKASPRHVPSVVPFLKRELFQRSVNEKRAHYAPRNRNLVIIIFIFESRFLFYYYLVLLLCYFIRFIACGVVCRSGRCAGDFFWFSAQGRCVCLFWSRRGAVIAAVR